MGARTQQGVVLSMPSRCSQHSNLVHNHPAPARQDVSLYAHSCLTCQVQVRTCSANESAHRRHGCTLWHSPLRSGSDSSTCYIVTKRSVTFRVFATARSDLAVKLCKNKLSVLKHRATNSPTRKTSLKWVIICPWRKSMVNALSESSLAGFPRLMHTFSMHP